MPKKGGKMLKWIKVCIIFLGLISFSSGAKSVVIMCNPRIYDKLQPDIARFVEDISNDGFNVYLTIWNGETHEEIREYLRQLPASELIAFIIIGEIPIPWYEYEEPYHLIFCPGYYAYLDADWKDEDEDSLFDGVDFGEKFITVGTLRSDLYSYGSEVALIRRYLRKNHLFRTGQLTFPLRGLVYSSFMINSGTKGIEYLYEDWDSVCNERTHAADLRKRLLEGVETIYAGGHSGYWGTAFGWPFNCTSTFMDDEISTLRNGVGLAIVYGCHLHEAYRLDGVVHGYSFGSLGALFTTCGTPGVDTIFFLQLSQGKSIAEALDPIDHHFQFYMSAKMTAGSCIGDPTLKFGGFYQRNSESISILNKPQNPLIDGWQAIPINLDSLWDGKPSVVSLGNGKVWCTWSSARGEHARAKCFAALYEESQWGNPEWVTHWNSSDITPWQVHHDITHSSLENPIVVTEIHSLYGFFGWNIAANIKLNDWKGVIISPSELETRNYPAVATSLSDEQVVFWHSWTKSDADIYGVWKEGESLGTPVCISNENSDERWVDATYSSNGELWIAFSERELYQDWNIVGLRIDPDTHQIIERVTLAYTLENERFPKLASDQEGRIWCVWQKDEDEGCDIWISLRESDTWGTPFPVTTEQGEDVKPAIAVNSQGDLAIVWMSNRTGSWDIWGKFFKNGEWTPEMPIIIHPDADIDPDICFLNDEEVLTVWSTDRDNNFNIYSAVGRPFSETFTNAVGEDGKKISQNVFFVSQHGPNPFKDKTSIKYGLLRSGDVDIVIYNLFGQKIRTLANKEEKAGIHTIPWDGKDDAGKNVSSGVYFVRLKAGDYTATRKVLMMR
jgi:hypothetical protein